MLRPLVAGMLLVFAALQAAMAVWVRRTGRGRAATAYVAVLLFSIWLTLGITLQVAVTSLSAKIAVFTLWTPAAILIPLSALVFILYYTGRPHWLTRPVWGLLVAYGVVMVGLMVTNPATKLFYTDFSLVTDPFPSLAYSRTLLQRVLGFPVVISALFSILLIVEMFVRSRRLTSKQFGLFVTGYVVILSFLGGLLIVDEIQGDIFVLAFILGTENLFRGVALFSDQLLAVQTIARDTVVSTVDDGVVVLDTDGYLGDYNESARDLFPALEDALGTPLSAVCPELLADDRTDVSPDAFVDDVHLPATATELDGDEDRKQRILSVDVSELTVGDTRYGYAVLLRDVTELRRLVDDLEAKNERLERKNEFLDEFASVVSHDVATPLTAVENRARLIELTGDTSHAADIYDATAQVQQLIDELETLAREGKRVGDTTAVDFETVLREAWQNAEAPTASLTVESTGTLQADRDRLRQLLENLLRNSVDHGSTSPDSHARQDAGGESSAEPSVADVPEDAVEHGSPRTRPGATNAERGSAASESVSIRAGTLPDGFYVADDGPGIPEGERDSVFERGYTTGPDNTGLGLAIVRRIVDGHGWVVDVTDSEDGGARFEITGVSVSDDTSRNDRTDGSESQTDIR